MEVLKKSLVELKGHMAQGDISCEAVTGGLLRADKEAQF